MSKPQFQDWLARETTLVNKALNCALKSIPPPCLPIATHILEAGGKRMRPVLTVLCARALGYAKEDIYPLAASLEMLHAATLLHDDILDNAAARRGKAAAHTIFGTTATILAGDALLASGNALVADYDNPALTRCYSQATTQTAAGEILEMDSLGRPDLGHEQYLAIARGKTACLISQACAMGALMANGSRKQVEACSTYGENLGMAFQIVDDALDFAPQSQTGKPCGGDLREGKMTPPIRLYRDSLDRVSRSKFDALFEGALFDDKEFARIVECISSYVPQTLALAKDCIDKARLALAELPAGEEVSILNQMADYVLSRNK